MGKCCHVTHTHARLYQNMGMVQPSGNVRCIAHSLNRNLVLCVKEKLTPVYWSKEWQKVTLLCVFGSPDHLLVCQYQTTVNYTFGTSLNGTVNSNAMKNKQGMFRLRLKMLRINQLIWAFSETRKPSECVRGHVFEVKPYIALTCLYRVQRWFTFEWSVIHKVNV